MSSVKDSLLVSIQRKANEVKEQYPALAPLVSELVDFANAEPVPEVGLLRLEALLTLNKSPIDRLLLFLRMSPPSSDDPDSEMKELNTELRVWRSGMQIAIMFPDEVDKSVKGN